MVVWPDNDEAGFKASDAVCVELRKIGAKSVKEIDREMLSKFPAKWDLADQLPSKFTERDVRDMMLFAKDKGIPYDRILHDLRLQGYLNHMGEEQSSAIILQIASVIEHRLRFDFKNDETDRVIFKETFQLFLEMGKRINDLEKEGVSEKYSLEISKQIALISAKQGREVNLEEIRNLRTLITNPTSSKLVKDHLDMQKNEQMPQRQLER